MLKLYCQKCGHSNAYVSEKPNFCQKCGLGFKGGLALATDANEDQNNLTEEKALFDLESLSVEIDSGRKNTVRMDSLMGTAKAGQTKLDGASPGGEEYTMEDFKKEAGNAERHEKEKT